MTIYCKAYRLAELRAFPGWAEIAQENEKEYSDDMIVYITETLKVTENCLDLEDETAYLVSNPDTNWSGFCRETLAFVVPDWEAESRAVSEALKETSSAG